MRRPYVPPPTPLAGAPRRHPDPRPGCLHLTAAKARLAAVPAFDRQYWRFAPRSRKSGNATVYSPEQRALLFDYFERAAPAFRA
ncbi:hypothetical protein AB0C13_39515, partial [Streptomyces sp. NPDC049099]